MAYILPAAANRRTPPMRRVRGMGCGCTRGLGAIQTLTASPFRRTFVPSTPSLPANQYGHVSLATNAFGTSSYPNTNGSNQNWRRSRGSSSTKVNTYGTPSTISSYDAYGNPIYAVPPPGQAVTGYDAAGTPLYGGASSGSQPAGLQTSAIIGTDPAGTPIYSTPPAGQTIVGLDAYGNPIYSGSAAASSLLTSAAASPATAAAAPATESDYQSVLDWLSESTLISGVPNWGVAAGAVAGFMLLQSRMAGRR